MCRGAALRASRHRRARHREAGRCQCGPPDHRWRASARSRRQHGGRHRSVDRARSSRQTWRPGRRRRRGRGCAGRLAGVVVRDPCGAFRGAARLRPRARGGGRRPGRHREPPDRQAAAAGARVRRAGHHRQHRVLRRRRPPARGPGSGGVLRRPHVVRPPRADRGRRLDRAVELPVADGRVEGAAGRRGGQHHRAQTGRDHPAHLADVRRGRAPRRTARRCGQRRDRYGPRRRRGAGRAPRRRHGELHRLHRGRPAGRHAGGRRRAPGAPRARGQGAVRRVRRRRPRGGGARRRRRRPDQHRAGLHSRDPGDRAPLAGRRLRRRRRRS